jgi:hypothetical protein
MALNPPRLGGVRDQGAGRDSDSVPSGMGAVKFSPGFDKAVLAPRQRAGDELDDVNAINNAYGTLIICMKMRQ